MVDIGGMRRWQRGNLQLTHHGPDLISTIAAS